MKKSEILIVNEDNTVLVFHTKFFDIFERSIKEDQVEMMSETSLHKLEVKTVAASRRMAQEMSQQMGVSPEEAIAIGQGRNLNYADTFVYEYPSNEIYFLSERQFGVYVYCNWRLIADLLKVEQKYECAMIFLIALHKKANRFNLGVEGQEKELSEYIQMLCIEYINKKLGRIKDMPEILANIMEEK